MLKTITVDVRPSGCYNVYSCTYEWQTTTAAGKPVWRKGETRGYLRYESALSKKTTMDNLNMYRNTKLKILTVVAY